MAESVKTQMDSIRECLKGLIGIPMIFDGNSLCPECLRKSMDIYGGTFFCRNCGSRFPATVFADKWGERWLKLNDV
ncbi:hypothetical protein LCGC14_1079100 [marine sediment metagenome]|uniref:Transposase zinc-ribbon domain-containing protein n=1 Tax=marine sediment metagenome TaxID=412755 RepID=A0A0F9MKE7_9ZZZZ